MTGQRSIDSGNKSIRQRWMTSGLRYALTLGIITALSAAIISFTYQHTAPIIAENEYNRLMATLNSLMPEADEYELVNIEGQEVYLGVKAQTVIGVVIPGQRNGFSGPVKVLVLLTPEGGIKDVVVQNQGETPGIGNKVKEPLFLSQFSGLTSGNSLLQEIDAISGATISSHAVTNGVSDAIELFVSLRF